jgi:hypothetical protein
MEGLAMLLPGVVLAALANATFGAGREILVSDKYTALRELEWVEFEATVPAGFYEVWVTSGGNDTRQAARLSVDGGTPVLVIDEREPAKELPPKEREKLLVTQLVGVISLKSGRHFFRVQHAGEPGFSNTFCLMKLRLVSVEGCEGKTLIPVGSQTKPSRRPPHPWEARDFLAAPKWWRDEEAYAGWYQEISEDALRQIKDKGLRVVVTSARGELRHWTEIAHRLGLRLLPYVSFHTWRWRFSPEEGKEQLADPGLLGSFEFARKHVGEVRWLEYWALAVHPEWMLLDAEGKPVSPFGPEYQAGSIREPCIDTEGVSEACLGLVTMLLEEGADGLFVDNVHPSGVCSGEKLGRHKHLHPNWTNTEAYTELLRKVREAVRKYGKDKIVMLNSGDPRAQFAGVGDSLMWESFLFDGGERLRTGFEVVLGAAASWEPYIRAGGTIAALSYIGGATPQARKANAFYAYACAKLCGFHFSDWFTADGTGAEVLYRLRLGKPTCALEEHEGIFVRRYEKGLVLVNPEGDGQDTGTMETLPPHRVALAVPSGWSELVDVYEGTTHRPVRGRVRVAIPPRSGRVLIRAK